MSTGVEKRARFLREGMVAQRSGGCTHFVGVVFESQFAVSLFDRVFVCILGDPEDSIVISTHGFVVDLVAVCFVLFCFAF